MELLIVMVIVGILSVILFKTFNTVSQLAFRIEQEKNVSNEILHVAQVLQNYADRNTIDYEQYSGLQESKGVTDVLYLSGEDGKFMMYSESGALYVTNSGNLISLTNPNKIILEDVNFKIIPWDAQGFDTPGFWLIMQTYNTRYATGQWANNVHIPVNEFFTLN